MQLRIIFSVGETKETVSNFGREAVLTTAQLPTGYGGAHRHHCLLQKHQTEDSDCSRKINGIFLPSPQDIFQKQCTRKATRIVGDTSHNLLNIWKEVQMHACQVHQTPQQLFSHGCKNSKCPILPHTLKQTKRTLTKKSSWCQPP